MKLRTFLGILLALFVVIAVAYLSTLNPDLLSQRFAVSENLSLPVHSVFIIVFLLGFLPAVSVLVVRTLRQELAQRRQRKLDREQKSTRGSFRRAVDLETDGQYARAAAELESCLVDQPEDFSALLAYGEVLRRSGRVEEALEVHRRASVLYPRSVAVLYQLADDYEARGETEVGDQIRDRILRDFPGLGLAELRRRRDLSLLARDWRESTRLQEKIDGLLAAGGVSISPETAADDEDRRLHLGLTYQRAVDAIEADQYDEALRLLDEVLTADPVFIPGLMLRGEIDRIQERPDAAVECWRTAFEETGKALFLLRIEDHFIEREEPLEAIENLHRVIAAGGSDLVPRFFLGRLYYRLEMLDEALRVLSPLTERVEQSPTLFYLLARIHKRRGEMGQAVECYQACVQQAGLGAADFLCSACKARSAEWTDRCEECGAWGSIELRFDARFAAAAAEDSVGDALPRRAVYPSGT